jgi:hypothetical protein
MRKQNYSMYTLKSNEIARGVYAIFGWIVASMSLISFIQRVLRIGLSATANSFVSYYRQLAHAVFGVPAELLGIILPHSLIDFWALSFVCAGAYARTENIEYARAFRSIKLKSPSIKLRVFVFLVFGFTGLAFFVPLSILSMETYISGDITRNAIKNLVIILLVVVVFYMLNAFSPSA